MIFASLVMQVGMAMGVWTWIVHPERMISVPRAPSPMSIATVFLVLFGITIAATMIIWRMAKSPHERGDVTLRRWAAVVLLGTLAGGFLLSSVAALLATSEATDFWSDFGIKVV